MKAMVTGGSRLTAGPSLACKAAARGEDYTIPFSGNTDFVYVADVAQAYGAAAGQPREGADVYNIAGEVSTSKAFAREVMMAAPGTTIGAAGPTLPIAPEIAAGSLREDYRGIPCTSIRDGAGPTVAHYRKN